MRKRMITITISILTILISLVGCSTEVQESSYKVKESNYKDRKLSTEQYILDEQILNESLEEMLNLLYPDGKVNAEAFVKEKKEMAQFTIKEAKLPEELNNPLIATREGDSILILDETEYLKRHDIYIWETNNESLKKLELNNNEGLIIVEFVFNNREIYWIESDCNYEDKNPFWNIKSYNIDTEKIREIDTSENYGRITLLPRLTASNNKLAYLVGEETESYNHHVILYDSLKNEKYKILNIENLISPYTKVFINNEVIAFPEYFKEGWKLLIYNLKDGSLQEEEMQSLTKGEYPQSFWFEKGHLAYVSSLNVLYSIELESGEQNIVSDKAGKGLIFDGNCIYTELGQLWVYNFEENSKGLLCDNTTHWIQGIQLNNDVVSTITTDNNEGKIYYYLELLKE